MCQDDSSLKEMLKTSDLKVSDKLINYLARTKHNYLLIKNAEYKATVIIPTKNLKEISVEGDQAYLRTINKIFIHGLNKSVDQFEVNLKNPDDDIIGFRTYDCLKRFLGDIPFNCGENIHEKIIFSPQLTNFLLKSGYKIVEIKQKYNNPEASVFVFRVGAGFYQKIKEFQELKKNNKEE